MMVDNGDGTFSIKPSYTFKNELTFEDIQQIYKDAFGWEITNPKDNWVLLAREIERRIKCK